ncbi:hypothetical protein BGX26_002567 [Mortierella sp. AD094]|nr:hypothetical protein BGX26_002567 [Mortierella sp. AD094]
MVNANNKSVVLLQHPTDYAVAGVHVGVQHKELNTRLNEGDILLRNLYVSVDPYLRGRMVGLKDSYIPSYEIHGAFDSYGISEVVETKNTKFPVGTLVTSPFIRWEEQTVLPSSIAKDLTILPAEVRDSKIPLSAYIGVLGMPGFTAYGSLLDIGQPKAGETIYISAASGAVGQLVGQIARLKGLRVVGSVGSDDKVDYLLKELKFDAAFNYKKGKIVSSLRAAAPEGIDIYYDNVGGEALEAALGVLKPHGRIIACGMVSGYNSDEGYNVKNLFQIVAKRLAIKGFSVLDFNEELNERFRKDVTEWFLNGDIVYKEDITEGLEDAPEAFVGLFQGKNFGKALVKIADL